MANASRSQTQFHGRTRPSDALSRLARLIKILAILSSKRDCDRVSRATLAEACGCNVRTVQRDIDLLNEAQVWVDFDRHTCSYAFASGDFRFPIPDWTLEDAAAMALARSFLNSPNVPQSAGIQRAMAKATASLSPGMQQLMLQAAKVVHVVSGPRDYTNAPIADLVGAATRRETIEIDYESRTSASRTKRLVDPYQIESGDGQLLYLHGWCHKNQAIRAFALDRVRGVAHTLSTFEINEGAWSRYLATSAIVGGLRGGAPVGVRARFDADVAAYALDRKWPEGLTIAARRDGTATLSGAVLGVDGMIAELLRWKRHVVVLGGPELRQAMVDEVERLAAVYQNISS